MTRTVSYTREAEVWRMVKGQLKDNYERYGVDKPQFFCLILRYLRTNGHIQPKEHGLLKREIDRLLGRFTTYGGWLIESKQVPLDIRKEAVRICVDDYRQFLEILYHCRLRWLDWLIATAEESARTNNERSAT